MKKRLLILLTIITIAIPSLWGQVMIDGLSYKLNEETKQAKLTYIYTEPKVANPYNGVINIPETVTKDGQIYDVTTIGKYAFSGTHVLEHVAISDTSSIQILYEMFPTLAIPDSIGKAWLELAMKYAPESVIDTATTKHSDPDSLRQLVVNIPNSVTTIEGGAFCSSTGLKSLKLPNSITKLDAFALNFALIDQITLPDSLRTIEMGAFEACEYLKTIKIPESVTSIGQRAFSHCHSLTSVNIPKSIKKIENSTFYNCSALTQITLPDSLECIDQEAFAWCFRLSQITIPATVKSIGKNAFKDCYELGIVFNLSPIPQKIEEDTFEKYGILYVPHGSKKDYEKAEYWNKFRIIELAPSDLKCGCEFHNEECQPSKIINIIPDGKKFKRIDDDSQSLYEHGTHEKK